MRRGALLRTHLITYLITACRTHARTYASCIDSVLALMRLLFKKLQVQHTVAAQRCGPVDNGCRACTATFNRPRACLLAVAMAC